MFQTYVKLWPENEPNMMLKSIPEQKPNICQNIFQNMGHVYVNMCYKYEPMMMKSGQENNPRLGRSLVQTNVQKHVKLCSKSSPQLC